MLFSALTPVRAADEKPIGILVAAGDIAYCDPEDAADEATAVLVQDVIRQADADQVPVRVLALGDLAYPSDKKKKNGEEKEFKCFDASWGQFKDKILPVQGNHDGSYFFKYFSYNDVAFPDGKGDGYYALNFPDPTKGPWRLIGLNAYSAVSKQLAWLEDDLTIRHPARWLSSSVSAQFVTTVIAMKRRSCLSAGSTCARHLRYSDPASIT
jgi:hypothetical protein